MVPYFVKIDIIMQQYQLKSWRNGKEFYMINIYLKSFFYQEVPLISFRLLDASDYVSWDICFGKILSKTCYV